MEEDFAWAILLFQEFTNAVTFPSDISGHRVIRSPSIGGQWRKRPALVVHRDYLSIG